MSEETDLLKKAHSLSERLNAAGIWNEVRLFREDGLTILAHVPGEYWEIDLLTDGSIDVEVFRSKGELEAESAVERLIAEHGNRTDEEE